MRDAVIVSAVRTPTGKFPRRAEGLLPPPSSARLVVREAVAPRRHRSGERGRMHHGQRRLRRPRPGTRPAGGARGGLPDASPR